MFIFTAKLTKKKLVAAIVAAGLVLCLLIVLVAARADAPPRETVSLMPDATGIRDNDDRMAFLTSCGWEVGAQPAEYTEVVIPETFDSVLNNYNELQASQGFDLLKYKGKRVMRYTYAVENYPTGEKNVSAVIFVYKNRVIAGDVHSASLDGFMHGLLKGDKPCDCKPGAACPPGCECTDCPK